MRMISLNHAWQANYSGTVTITRYKQYHTAPMMLSVLETTGDKKSFGFRPEQSTLDAHACVLEA